MAHKDLHDLLLPESFFASDLCGDAAAKAAEELLGNWLSCIECGEPLSDNMIDDVLEVICALQQWREHVISGLPPLDRIALGMTSET